MALTTEQLRARAKFWREKAIEAKWESVSIAQDMLLNAAAFDELANNREALPAAWRHDNGPFAGMALTRSKSVSDSWMAKGWVVTPLYTAPQTPAVPDGFRIVPTIPTSEMIAAAMNCDDVTFINLEDFYVNFGNIYAAMLAAAPEGRSND